jgi:hypothetical protein
MSLRNGDKMKPKLLIVLGMLFMSGVFLPMLIPGGVAEESAPRFVLDENPIFLPVISRALYTDSANLNGVELTVGSPIMPSAMQASDPDDNAQLVGSFATDPFEELSINSVAYGQIPPTEDLPAASQGGAGTYRSLLVDLRIDQGGTPLPGPVASLFGQDVTSNYSILALKVSGESEQSIVIVEWVVEALSRLWIVRVSKDLDDIPNLNVYLNSLESLVINGNESAAIAQKADLPAQSAPSVILDNQEVDTLPFPAWWSGECNDANFFAATGVHSERLGDPYDGLVACGPLNYERPVNFFSGARTQYEFQCAELAKRYLYLKYNIAPYQAHGKDVVNNMPAQYIGTTFERIWNGTPNKAPRAGDVISLGATTTYGHVVIVTAANVDASGNGQVWIIEQNWSQNGHRSLPVANWRVGGSMSVTNWLHDITVTTSTRRWFSCPPASSPWAATRITMEAFLPYSDLSCPCTRFTWMRILSTPPK